MGAQRRAQVTHKASPEPSGCRLPRFLHWTKSPRTQILGRCARYHLVPVSSCIVLVYVNLKTLYLGNNLTGTTLVSDAVKLQALQLAAKLHEVFMVASLSLAALDIITYRLVHSRRGLPLGMMSASFFLEGNPKINGTVSGCTWP